MCNPTQGFYQTMPGYLDKCTECGGPLDDDWRCKDSECNERQKKWIEDMIDSAYKNKFPTGEDGR